MGFDERPQLRGPPEQRFRFSRTWLAVVHAAAKRLGALREQIGLTYDGGPRGLVDGRALLQVVVEGALQSIVERVVEPIASLLYSGHKLLDIAVSQAVGRDGRRGDDPGTRDTTASLS